MDHGAEHSDSSIDIHVEDATTPTPQAKPSIAVPVPQTQGPSSSSSTQSSTSSDSVCIEVDELDEIDEPRPTGPKPGSVSTGPTGYTGPLNVYIPESILGETVRLDVHRGPTQRYDRLCVSCPFHRGCDKKRNISINHLDLGPRSVEAYLGAWLQVDIHIYI